MSKISGVYLIKNIINRKIYIGSSLNVNKRINKHFAELRRGKHYNILLQRTYNKYGESSFIYGLLEDNLSSNIIVNKEQYYLDLYQPYNPDIGFNICEKAYTTLGYKHSEETKKKMSIDRKNNGEKYAKYGKDHHMYGKTYSEETKRKMRMNHADHKGEKSSLAKLNENKVLEIRRLYATGEYTFKSIAPMFDINSRTVGKIVNRERWKHI